MENNLRKIVSIFKVLGDERRLRMLKILMQRELCVCEVMDILNLPQYEASRHLGFLKEIGLVTDRRDGLWVYYSIPERVKTEPFVGELLRLLDRHVSGAEEAAQDLKRLRKRLARRAGNRCVVGVQT